MIFKRELEKQIVELKKENAELKKFKRDCETSVCRANCQYTYEQLTKAKKIISDFVEWANWQEYINDVYNNGTGDNKASKYKRKCPSLMSIKDKAEQFLSEVEK